MSLKSRTFLALAAAALAVPALASAQQSYGPPQDPQSYGAPPAAPAYQAPSMQGGPMQGGPMQGGPQQRHHAPLGVYPQFHAMEKHIRRTVREARRANALAPREAHSLMAQLHRIEADEMQVYQAHGMNLPAGDQARIQGELTQLAQAVDQPHAQQ